MSSAIAWSSRRSSNQSYTGDDWEAGDEFAMKQLEVWVV
jgi:hypothetical protein